ncbi:MAG TPA: terminase [Phycisphaerales bacterium]|nr:MAG: hypothetical protein A2Y13_01165 [Planctomycetes bacterium GWC2_45_44]HBG77486.1 terminase [Phycisphaerales bacterium]HBR19094.1 terminase [Phycisphaerales bacterium]
MVAVCEKSAEPEKTVKIVWQPYKGSSQEVFLTCPIFECLYEGTRGPGKSVSLLMDFAQFVGKGYGRHWKGIIFREEFERLEELIDKSIEYFSQIFPTAVYNKSNHYWEFATGEKLYFRYAKKEADYWKFHGKGYPFVGWDEITSWPDDKLYIKMMSICRSAYPDMPRRYRATCNPYGVGHNWVKARFIDPVPAGIIIEEKDEKTGSIRERVRIHGSIWENLELLKNDPDYIKNLEAQPGVVRKAWLYGDWDIIAGGMFDDVWDSSIHVIPPFTIPATWRLDRSFDWGSSHPYAVCFWAESDGSDIILADGTHKSTKKGSLYLIAELYGWNGKPNEGTKEVASEIARKIKQFEKDYGKTFLAGAADSSIFDVQNGNSYAADMERMGIGWTKADKSPGSRINGWEIMRQRLKNSMTGESAGLYIFNTCRQFIRTFPVLPRDETKMQDVDSEAEDHIADAARYKIATKTHSFTSESMG